MKELILRLPIKKKWFDLIKSGEKREEYREAKPYWDTRIWHNWWEKCRHKRDIPVIEFINGYSRKSPRFRVRCVECSCSSFTGHPEWGEPAGEHFVLKLDNEGGVK